MVYLTYRLIVAGVQSQLGGALLFACDKEGCRTSQINKLSWLLALGNQSDLFHKRWLETSGNDEFLLIAGHTSPGPSCLFTLFPSAGILSLFCHYLGHHSLTLLSIFLNRLQLLAVILSCTLEGSIPFENVFFVVAKTLLFSRLLA